MAHKAVKILLICAWAVPVDVDLKSMIWRATRTSFLKKYVLYDASNSFFGVCVFSAASCVTVFFSEYP